MTQERPFRVLSLDGGGMRGAYASVYLSCLSAAFAQRRGAKAIDVGQAFDLIVGTSAGAILACALAAGIQAKTVAELYSTHGQSIFVRRLPRSFGPKFMVDLFARKRNLARGEQALRSALHATFGDQTLGEIWTKRGIALAITAVELEQHRAWVFKTPHLHHTTNHRDDNYRLVDVCLASTAAPIYRSLAAVKHPDSLFPGRRVFADGGLWANNPVLVSLLEACQLCEGEREVQIFCLGTCARPAGEQVAKGNVCRDLLDWRFGALVANLALDVQETAYDSVARMLLTHLKRPARLIRFPRGQPPASLMDYLDLDDTRDEAVEALANQARSDADTANSRCADKQDRDGALLRELFEAAPSCSLDGNTLKARAPAE